MCVEKTFMEENVIRGILVVLFFATFSPEQFYGKFILVCLVVNVLHHFNESDFEISHNLFVQFCCGWLLAWHVNEYTNLNKKNKQLHNWDFPTFPISRLLSHRT